MAWTATICDLVVVPLWPSSTMNASAAVSSASAAASTVSAIARDTASSGTVHLSFAARYQSHILIPPDISKRVDQVAVVCAVRCNGDIMLAQMPSHDT